MMGTFLWITLLNSCLISFLCSAGGEDKRLTGAVSRNLEEMKFIVCQRLRVEVVDNQFRNAPNTCS